MRRPTGAEAEVALRTEAFPAGMRSGDNGLLAAGAEDWVDLLGQLVEDAALREELADPERCRQMGQAARCRAALYSDKHMAQRTLDIYASVLEKRGTR